MNQCWCYQCNKYVIPTSDFHCPFCHEDYLEFEDDPNPNTPISQPQQSNQQQQQMPQFQMFHLNFPFNMTNFDPFQIFNNIFQNRNDFQPHLGTIFQNVINRFPRAMGPQPNGGNGIQMNDFFFGSEEQLQALAERLFRLNEQSLGSPPTDENFVNQLQSTEYHQNECIEDVCSICLDQFEEGTKIIILPCKHAFHPDCLSPWLKIHSECPSCRHKLPPKQ